MLTKSIYEMLPITYITGGILSISMIETFVSFLSGILLVVSGIAILKLRRKYRNSRCEFPRSRLSHYSS